MNQNPVIFVHGWASSQKDWGELMPQMARAGYNVHALDLLGHGESIKPSEKGLYHFESVYDHFDGWIKSLQLEAPPILIGHSLGGFLSLAYAIRNPEALDGLVLINPLYKRKQLTLLLRMVFHSPALSERALAIIPGWLVELAASLDPSHQPPLPGSTRRQMVLDLKRASPHITYIPRSMPRLEGNFEDISIPTLVIWGEKDLTLRPASFQALVEKLPNANGHAIPGCGHQPHLARPEQVSQLVLDFLERLSIQPGASS